MATYGFGHKVHDLKYLKVGFVKFHEFIINLRASLQLFLRKTSFEHNYIIFKKVDMYLFNITYLNTTCTVF